MSNFSSSSLPSFTSRPYGDGEIGNLPNKILLLLKCFMLIQDLPEEALKESLETLEEISEFYAERSTQNSLPTSQDTKIIGKITSTEVRSPIVLEP